jgi:hypothetical protein
VSKRSYSTTNAPHYSESTPRGPYTAPRWPHELAKAEQYVEGLSSKKNLAQWSERASKNSGPKQMPGLGEPRDPSTLPAVKPSFRESE